jgi:hypothetical protein
MAQVYVLYQSVSCPPLEHMSQLSFSPRPAAASMNSVPAGDLDAEFLNQKYILFSMELPGCKAHVLFHALSIYVHLLPLMLSLFLLPMCERLAMDTSKSQFFVNF